MNDDFEEQVKSAREHREQDIYLAAMRIKGKGFVVADIEYGDGEGVRMVKTYAKDIKRLLLPGERVEVVLLKAVHLEEMASIPRFPRGNLTVKNAGHY